MRLVFTPSNGLRPLNGALPVNLRISAVASSASALVKISCRNNIALRENCLDVGAGEGVSR